jgi:hypothetical protein
MRISGFIFPKMQAVSLTTFWLPAKPQIFSLKQKKEADPTGQPLFPFRAIFYFTRISLPVCTLFSDFSLTV